MAKLGKAIHLRLEKVKEQRIARVAEIEKSIQASLLEAAKQSDKKLISGTTDEIREVE